MRVMFKRKDDAYYGIEVVSIHSYEFFWRYIGESRFHKLDCELHEVVGVFEKGFGWKYIGKIDD